MSTLELGWKKLSGKREFKRNYKFDKERKKEGEGEWSSHETLTLDIHTVNRAKCFWALWNESFAFYQIEVSSKTKITRLKIKEGAESFAFYQIEGSSKRKITRLKIKEGPNVRKHIH